MGVRGETTSNLVTSNLKNNYYGKEKRITSGDARRGAS